MRTRQRSMKTDYYLGKDSESDSDSEKEKISSKDKYWNGDSEKLEVKEIDNHIYFYSKVCKKSAQR